MSLPMRAALALVLLTGTLPAAASSITGSISTTDHLTTDSTLKTFYTDYFNIGVTADATLELNVQSLGPLLPYLLVLDTDASGLFLPVSDWESPDDLYSAALFASPGPGGDPTAVGYTLNATGGVLYQVAVTSANYIEDTTANTFGDYLFTVGGANGDIPPQDLIVTQVADPDPTTVAEPAPLGLAGFGLLALAALRRRRA